MIIVNDDDKGKALAIAVVLEHSHISKVRDQIRTVAPSHLGLWNSSNLVLSVVNTYSVETQLITYACIAHIFFPRASSSS